WAVPVFLLVAGVALTIWLRTATLDPIAKRILTYQFIKARLWEHVKLTFVSTVLVVAIALVVGVVLSRQRLRFLSPPILAIANIGQGAPAIGIIVLLAVIYGTGFWVAVWALVAFSVLPALRNTVVGLSGVDRQLIEAGRGIGMSTWTVLWRVELPL